VPSCRSGVRVIESVYPEPAADISAEFQQIYLLNSSAKKYTDEILGLLFAKFDGNVAEMFRVSERLASAHSQLSTSFRGRAAGMAVKGRMPRGLDYGPPQIVATAILLANQGGSSFKGDVSDMKGVV